MKEVFVPIKDYEDGYLISNLGRVKTLKFRFAGNILKNQNNTYGYHHVLLCKNGNRKTKLIHQLVIDAFYPILRKGSNLLVDHKDNNRKNNKITNLRLVDFRGNQINRKDKQFTASKNIGVTYCKNIKKKPWMARRTINGVRKYLGHFETEKEASIMVNETDYSWEPKKEKG